MHTPPAPREALAQQMGKSTEQSELVMFFWMQALRFASEHKYFLGSCKENSFYIRQQIALSGPGTATRQPELSYLPSQKLVLLLVRSQPMAPA